MSNIKYCKDCKKCVTTERDNCPFCKEKILTVAQTIEKEKLDARQELLEILDAAKSLDV